MFQSKDGKIKVTLANSPSDVIYDPADWSIHNLPTDTEEAEKLSSLMYSMPVSNHVMALFCRHKRNNKIKAYSNLGVFSTEDKKQDWDYFETASVWYEKPSSCSNNGFLPVSETAFILYKGDSPDANYTGWFSEDYNNATNLWPVNPQPDELVVFKHTYNHRFSWEFNLLVSSICRPMNYRSFIYTLPFNKKELKSIHEMCKTHNLKAQLFSSVENEKEIEELLKGLDQ